MKMNKNKIGTIFMISVLALAGIGISYAGLTDEINIYGTVSTGTVDLEITDYSGTWVWKVFDDPDEVVITHDPDYSVSLEEGFLVSYATGRDVTADDPTNPNNNNEPYDAVLEFSNLFPCIDFMADIVFHYEGTIPAKVNYINWDWVGDPVTLPDGTIITDFIDWLWANGHMTGGFYRCDENGNLLNPSEEVVVGYQLHQCNYFKLMVTIHLPQENWLQGLEGSGYVNIGVLQWNDQCEPVPGVPDIEIIKVVNDETPLFDVPFDYTITAKNIGSGDASGVKVNDLLPDDINYLSDNPSQGTYNHVTGDWDIGYLPAGGTATLIITVNITSIDKYTQLALLLDGSGSITGDDWGVMLEGIASAITNGYIPHNGQVELTVIQFGGWNPANDYSWAQVEIGGPIVLDGTNYNDVADDIEDIVQLGGATPMSCAFHLAADIMSGDTYNKLPGTLFEGMASTHSDWPRQVINLITDGQPNVIYDDSIRYNGIWQKGPNRYVLGKADTELALTYFESLITIEEGVDEIDSEAVGDGTDVDVPWLRDHVVRPQPGNLAPPFIPGWVISVADYTELADTLYEKFLVIFPPIENCATLVEPTDTNPSNDQSCVTVIPQIADLI
jgi:uncharacterized repeat protein (TIGR01451 family)